MSQEEFQVCDACGVTAEMGFVISEGDDTAEVIIFASNPEDAIAEFQSYALLAKEVNANVIHDFNADVEFAFDPLKANFKFECSAEKLIFELRSRSLAK